MPNDDIPPTDHVARHCKGAVFDDGKISSRAFMLRKDASGKPREDYLSVNWLEKYAEGDRERQLEALRRVLHPQVLTLRQSHCFAVLNVGATQQFVEDSTAEARLLPFRCCPTELDYGHAGIFDTTTDGDEQLIAELIADCVRDVCPAL